MNNLNVADIRTYLNFISHHPFGVSEEGLKSPLEGDEKEIFTFALFDKKSEHPFGHGLSTVFDTAEGIIKTLTELNSSDYTLHVCLNRTSHKGRKVADVQSVRVLCVDIDKFTSREDLHVLIDQYKPQLHVKTSKNGEGEAKYHLYWQVDSGIPLETWKIFQLGLAHKLGGDFNLSQLNHTIRVPGVERLLKDAVNVYMPEIFGREFKPIPLGIAEIETRFPWIYEESELAAKLLKKLTRLENKAFEGLLENVGLTNGEVRTVEIDDAVVNQFGRNTTLYRMVSRFIYEKESTGVEVGIDEVISFGLNINQSFKEPLEKEELKKTLESASRGMGEELVKHSKKQAKMEEILSELRAENAGSGFKYDYESRDLKLNKFSDIAIVARILQKFGERIVRTDMGVFAFSEIDKVWRRQDRDNKVEFFGMFCDVIADVFADEAFIETFATTAKGNISIEKFNAAKMRFLSGGMFSTITNILLNGSDTIRTARFDIFDADRNRVYVLNGVLDLVSGEITQPLATDHLLKQIEIDWNRGAECPGWLEFLNEVFNEADDVGGMINFMQELFGYTLSGHVNQQKIFCHYGNGANGKSKILSALKMLGGEYSVYVAPDEFCKVSGGYGKEFERFGAKADGKRVVIVDDLEVGGVWNESLVKALTSHTFSARRLYKESVEVRNQGTFHLGLNVAPSPQAENYGILRRLCLIPYTRQFAPSGETSDRIDRMIEAEKSGILRWAQAGFNRYYETRSLSYPREIDQAIEEYKEEHFILQNIVKRLYEVPEDADAMRFNYEIEADVKKYVEAELQMKRPFTLKEITNAITQSFNIKSSKTWCKEKKNALRGFNLKLVFDYNEISPM